MQASAKSEITYNNKVMFLMILLVFLLNSCMILVVKFTKSGRTEKQMNVMMSRVETKKRDRRNIDHKLSPDPLFLHF